MPELPDSATSGLGTGWLMESFYCDIDSDGTNETVGKYMVDSSSYFPVFYRVYDDGYHTDYYGQPGASAYGDYAMVHDYNTGETYLADIITGGGMHGSKAIYRYSGQFIARAGFLCNDSTDFVRSYDGSIKGSEVSFEKACSYINNIAIIETTSDSRNMKNELDTSWLTQ